MKAEKHLREVMELDARIHATQMQCEEIQTRLEGVSAIAYDKPSVMTSHNDLNINLYSALIDKENELKAQILDFIQHKDYIIKEIYMLENTVYANLLYKRYIEYDKETFRPKRFEQIACEMHYSFDGVRHMHLKAIKAFQKLIDS